MEPWSAKRGQITLISRGKNAGKGGTNVLATSVFPYLRYCSASMLGRPGKNLNPVPMVVPGASFPIVL